jgi:integrase
MAHTLPSRPATLADLITAVDEADLPKRRSADLLSAIRTVARLLGAQPEDIVADPRLIAKRLTDITGAGLSQGRKSNIKSLLRQAFALARPVMPGNIRTPMLPAWTALYEQLATRTYKVRLSRLLRWLSAQAVEPHEVSLKHLQAFEQALLHEALIAKPEDAWRTCTWAWKRARETVPGWPQLEVSLPSRRKDFSLPWSAFPPSLKADVDAYLRRLSGHDLLEARPFRSVRQSTREIRAYQIRVIATALVISGAEPAEVHSIAALVTVPNIKLALRFFIARKGGTSSTIKGLAAFLKSLATHWVKAPQGTIDEIAALIRNLSTPSNGMTAKNRARLRPFDDPDNVDALLQVPRQLMAEAGSNKYSPRRAAVAAQTAVMIELLLMRPLRIDNLRQLDINDNLIWPSRRREVLHIVIMAHDVKNSVALEHRLPDESTTLLLAYVEKYRPLLAIKPNTALFPGKDSEGLKSRGAMSTQIKRAVKRLTGLTINPHLFRHIAAKLHLDNHPGEYGVVSQVLGHKRESTTRAAYTGMETDAAVKRFDATVLKLRQEGSPSRARSRSQHAPISVKTREELPSGKTRPTMRRCR